MKKKDIIHLLDTYDLKFKESCRNHLTNPPELQKVLCDTCEKTYMSILNLISEKVQLDIENNINRCNKYKYNSDKISNHSSNLYYYYIKYIQCYKS